MTDSDVVAVHGDWLVRADRESVYVIVSDFERMPEHFPKVARAMRLVERDGDVPTVSNPFCLPTQQTEVSRCLQLKNAEATVKKLTIS